MKAKYKGEFIFNPCLGDIMMSQHYSATKGQKVKVTELPGAPKAGTMGQVHIKDAATDQFLGMVYFSSLDKIKK